jgi:hypothetical protein
MIFIGSTFFEWLDLDQNVIEMLNLNLDPDLDLQKTNADMQH